MTGSPVVLILGASSAIAADIARLYAARGARLGLVARSEEKLSSLVAELGQSVAFSARRDFARTDLAEPLVQQAWQALGRVDTVIIAHGLLGDQAESERSFEAAAEIVHVNYLSVLALLVPLANALERQGAGQLAVLSSVAAERGRPRNYTYASAKSALNTYLQGLRSRLYRHGVGVHTIKLGPVDTPMTVGHTKNALFASPAVVARQVVRALDSRAAEVFVPKRWRLIMPIVRSLPEVVFQRIASLSGR